MESKACAIIVFSIWGLGYMNKQVLLDLIRTIPYFSTVTEELFASVEFTLLPSNTNNTYKIYFKQGESNAFVLKIPKSTTNLYVNRDNVKHNTAIAFKLALTAEPLWFGDSEQQGMSLSRYLTRSRTLTPLDLKQSEILKNLAKSLKVLQNSRHDFIGNFTDAPIMRSYLDQYFEQCAKETQNKLSINFKKAQQALDQIELSALPINSPVPAHMDLMADNLLIQDSNNPKVWLIDWEYSAMASPYWDIATLCNVANFNQYDAKVFLRLILDDCENYAEESVIKNLTHYRQIVRSFVECWRGAFANKQ